MTVGVCQVFFGTKLNFRPNCQISPHCLSFFVHTANLVSPSVEVVEFHSSHLLAFCQTTKYFLFQTNFSQATKFCYKCHLNCSFQLSNLAFYHTDEKKLSTKKVSTQSCYLKKFTKHKSME